MDVEGPQRQAKTRAVNDDALKVEELLVQWFGGQNRNGLQIDADADDLNRFCAYAKAMGPRATEQLLPQLLTSPYLRQLRPPRRIPNCVPKLHFRAIGAPYETQYRALVQQYQLQEFVLDGGGDGRIANNSATIPNFKVDAMRNTTGAADIYMCFIQFGTLYAVNLLPAPSSVLV